ncbi:serine/threonine protein kinase [Nocardia vinacea]|uniref:non-specific serine/threonine protein kinase n=2 Tax=Nocardia vinacea TaxID=96468 RepID=A0ABZ1YYK9_9NOCA|nr:serine/threonine protein kinase [Nocardia vinacea]
MNNLRPPLTAGSTFGKYRLRRLIGAGGMGRVFEALDTTKGRVVAVKVLPEQLADDPVYRARFRRESHIAALLQEPHVIPIHDYGEIDGLLYIDMRLVDGESLRTVVRTNGPLPPEQAVSVISQIAAGLDAAHHDGLIHRDIKPDNILLTHDGFAYLADFGLANSNTDERLTQTGSAIGSFNYMAPERFRAGPATPAVDVYALACVLHECLTGTRPYSNDGGDAAIMRAHMIELPPRTSSYAPGIPVSIDAVVARGMAKSPDERYASAGELAAAAHAALASPPGDVEDDGPLAVCKYDPTVAAHPTPRATSTPEARSVPAPRRRPRRLWIAAATAVAAVVAVGAWPLLHKPAPPTPGPAARSEFTDDDVTLLKLLEDPYNRTICHHLNPQTILGEKAHLICDEIPEIRVPSGEFYLFPNADALGKAYHGMVLQTSSCPGYPPGPDGPATRGGREVGRMACFTNATTTPPTSGVIQTDDAAMSMAVFSFTESVGGSASLYWTVHDTGEGNSQFRTLPKDPDVYTQADLDLITKLPKAYDPRFCRHEAPESDATAVVLCFGNESGAPTARFFQFPNHPIATQFFDGVMRRSGGRACDDATVPEQPWIRNGTTVGRFTCITDPMPTLVALDQRSDIAIQAVSVRPDSPSNRPKTDLGLFDWFKKNPL